MRVRSVVALPLGVVHLEMQGGFYRELLRHFLRELDEGIALGT